MNRRFPRLWALFFGGLLNASGVFPYTNPDATPSLERPDLQNQDSPEGHEERILYIPPGAPRINPTSLTLARRIPSFFQPVMSLLSTGGIGEWIGMLALGGFLEIARRWVFGTWDRAFKMLYRTATLEEYDQSYEWMLLWLTHQPSWVSAQSMDVTTGSELRGTMDFIIRRTPGSKQLQQGDCEFRGKSVKPIGFVPSPNQMCTFWWRGRYVWVERTSEKVDSDGSSSCGQRCRLVISILTQDINDIRTLIHEAGELYMERKKASVCTYISESQGWWLNWKHISCTPKRSMQSIVLEPEIKDLLLEDAHEFLNSQEWYSARGIPYRRGYLLYGAPGSGKTSFIHCLAGELGLDIYIISLSKSNTDDTTLGNMISSLPARCIALMEDIDAALIHELNREGGNSPGSPRKSPKLDAGSTGNGVTLSGLLNALDGVGAHEGRILFATTNKYSDLDPALCRPGRMDIHIEFQNACKWQAKELFLNFYCPQGAIATDADPSSTPDVSGQTKSLNKGSETGSSLGENTAVIAYSGRLSKQMQAGSLTAERLKEFANLFSETIPSREFSMASLQGYLMMYKTRPSEATERVAAWVEKTRMEAQKARELKKEREEKGLLSPMPLQLNLGCSEESATESNDSPGSSNDRSCTCGSSNQVQGS